MCGISGIVNFRRNNHNLLELVVGMNSRIRHRGPDDEGLVAFNDLISFPYATSETPENVRLNNLPYLPKVNFNQSENLNYEVVLGHRRLSIIQLSHEGHQPMTDTSERYWIVFNGAIYNYEELRADLIAKGHIFYSTTDTEVLLHSYMEWGAACINKFIGMWAFVIYDKVEKKLFGSRDRIGVKPLYYFFNQSVFAFASEIKALRTLPFIPYSINDKAVYDYLILGKCEEEEESIVNGIIELFPGYCFELNCNDEKLNKWKYYNPIKFCDWEEYNEIKNNLLVSELAELLERSIEFHLKTEVSVGACLSGGLDSSLIVSIASQLRPNIPVFTVTSKGEKEDESFWAKKVVDSNNLKWYTTNPQSSDLFSNLEKLMDCQDMPCMTSKTYAQFELMRLVKEQGVKVTIDGQGADELFAGYDQYFPTFFMDALSHGSLSSVADVLFKPSNDFARKKLLVNWPAKVALSHLFGSYLTAVGFKEKYAEFEFIKNDFWMLHTDRLKLLQNKISTNLNNTLFNDFHGGNLKTMLRAGDRNSMNFGVESRVPFADDFKIGEFALKVPAVYKVKNNFSKSLLREAGKKWLSSDICWRKDKKGFSVPEKKWMLEFGNEVLQYFDSNLEPYINTPLLKKNWSKILSETENTNRLWRMLSFAIWMRSLKQSK